VLYDQSSESRSGGGTSNKTEILTGYTTPLWRSASAIIPWETCIKPSCVSYPKRWVCRRLSFDKAPTADLWVGQTDEGELGFTYAQVDKLLYMLVDERFTPDECIESGFPRPFVDTVVERIRVTTSNVSCRPLPNSAIVL